MLQVSFFPNQYILKDYDKKYEIAYLEKLKELDLREPEFAYANDLQFVKLCTNVLII